MPPPPNQQNTSGSSFRQRLAYYLIGVSIGLVALGFLWSQRQQAASQSGAAGSGSGSGSGQQPAQTPGGP